jgi:SAM-dependent methyltransferase
MSWTNIALIVLLVILFPTAYAAKIGAPYVPARKRALAKMLEYIALGPDDIFVDLGAGDGKVVLAAARRGAKAVGYELSPLMWLIAWLRALPYKNARIIWKNFYKQPLSDATVIYAFLVPTTMERLRKYLAAQRLPQGKHMLVYAFPFKDIPPLQVIREPQCLPVYIYDLQELTRQE